MRFHFFLSAKKESEEERTSQKEEENGDCIVLSSTSDQNEQRRPVKSEEPLIVKLPDCLPTTSKHLDPVPQPTAFPTGRGVDFKTTYQTEVLCTSRGRGQYCIHSPIKSILSFCQLVYLGSN